jgi:hypothetical protein
LKQPGFTEKRMLFTDDDRGENYKPINEILPVDEHIAKTDGHHRIALPISIS